MKPCPLTEEIFEPDTDPEDQEKVFSKGKRAMGEMAAKTPFRYLPAAERNAMEIFFPAAARTLLDVIGSQQA
jgi:hypothetical protein